MPEFYLCESLKSPLDFENTQLGRRGGTSKNEYAKKIPFYMGVGYTCESAFMTHERPQQNPPQARADEENIRLITSTLAPLYLAEVVPNDSKPQIKYDTLWAGPIASS